MKTATVFLLLVASCRCRPHLRMAEPRDPSCVRSAWNFDGRDIDEATNIDPALMDGYIAPSTS